MVLLCAARSSHRMLLKTTLWSSIFLLASPSSVVVAWQTATLTSSQPALLRHRQPTTTRLFMTTAASSSSSSDTEEKAATVAPTTVSPDVVPFVKPDRVIRDELPTVYVYDHCPFCVRVRFALGVKNIKHLIHFLANDDIATPTKLVGKKIAPIFEWPEADVCMAESMDICKLVDSDDRMGTTQAIQPATDRTDIKAWQASVRDLLRTLQRPRYVATGLLPEFQQLDGRHAFIKNHPMPPYEKAEWKNAETMTMQEKLTVYAEAMAKDPAEEVEEVNRKLVELADILCCDQHCSPGGLSYDDVDLFSRLRSITIIKGVEWPTVLRNYMDNMAELSDVPLYDQMAL